MKFMKGIAGTAAIFGLVGNALAVFLAKGTPVTLAFDDAVNSRHVHVGDKVRFHVVDDVTAGGKVVIKSGTPVTAVISEIQKQGHFGKNAQLKLTINPVRVGGALVPLQPRQKGNMIGGTRGSTAAGAAGAGALVLGPLGLGAGYFVVGKAVNAKPGDKLETQVSSDVNVK